MIYRDATSGQPLLLNLVDTPGHVDFSYEVNRSLSACEGVLLLVDCAQGIQAQTLATYYAATERQLHVVPVLTKIDVPYAEIDDSLLSLSSLLDVDPDDVLLTSAKSGDGIEDLLGAIGDRLRMLARVVEYVVPYDRGDVLAALHRAGEVLMEVHADSGTRVQARLPDASAGRFAEFSAGATRDDR